MSHQDLAKQQDIKIFQKALRSVNVGLPLLRIMQKLITEK